jgi:hypothetical protein
MSASAKQNDNVIKVNGIFDERSLITDKENSNSYFISFLFGIILPLLLIVIGTTGNVLSVAVLYRLKKRTTRTSLFVILIGLAVADSMLLLCTLLVNVLPNAFRFLNSSSWWVLYEPYRHEGYIVVAFWPLSLAFQMASIYCTMLVSYERWMAVCKPLRVSKSQAISHITITVILLFLACFIYNIPRFFEYGIQEKVLQVHDMNWKTWEMLCGRYVSPILYNNDSSTTIFLYEANATPCLLRKFFFVKTNFANEIGYRFVYSATFYSLCHFIVPVVFISWCNIQLVSTLKQRHHMWTTITRSQRKEIRLTYVPLAIICLFYFLGLPAVLINIIDSLNYATDNGYFEAWLTVANFCVLLNSSVNFLIYCFWGEKFQQTLCEMLGCSNVWRERFARASRMERGAPICASYRLTASNYDGLNIVYSHMLPSSSLGSIACKQHFDMRLPPRELKLSTENALAVF